MAAEYSKVKKVLWRFGRVFVATFLVVAGTNLQALQDGDLVKLVVIPALSGALVALGKAVREYLKDEIPVVRKLIF